jgi:uncharacterized membrane protein YdjX (TVP38/TMEM64 family)
VSRGFREDEAGAPLVAVVATLVGIALLVALVVLVVPLREVAGAALRGDAEEVRARIDDLGLAGPLILLGLCLAHAVIFFPAEIVDAAAGYAYGFGPGLALVCAGWMLNGWVAYAIGRTLARPLLHKALGRERFRRAEATVERGGLTLLLGARLVPIFPFSVVCYACGACRIPAWRFTWTTAVGYLPITIIATYLGSRLEDVSPTDPLVLGAVAIFALMLLAAHWLVPRPRQD